MSQVPTEASASSRAEESGEEVDASLYLCPAATVADGSAVKVEAGDLVVAVFNIGGEIYVIDDTCTHGPGSLSDGYVEGEVVECGFHNGAFNVRTGAVVMPPCMVPVRTYAAVIRDGGVYIDPNRSANGVTR